MRKVVVLLFFALALCAQLLVVTPAEVSCDSAAHAISTAGVARWVQFMAPTGNAAVVRWGDSNTSTSRGSIIAAGGAQLLPPVGESIGYDLTKIYYFCTTGDKLEITWVK